MVVPVSWVMVAGIGGILTTIATVSIAWGSLRTDVSVLGNKVGSLETKFEAFKDQFLVIPRSKP